jgi:hypothetical protein
MKKAFLLVHLTVTVLLTTLITTGCKKEKSNNLTPDQEEEVSAYATTSEIETELIFNDVFDNVMGVNKEVGIGGTGVFGRLAGAHDREWNMDSVSCFTVTATRLNPPELFPVKITLDFGNGCTGKDGHTRYGKMITVYTGRLVEPGKSATTTFDGFQIDSITVKGTHQITNTATSQNQLRYTVSVADGRLSKPNGAFSEWTGEREIRQENNSGQGPSDYIFSIRGSAHGRVSHGNKLYAWQSEVKEPLRKKFSCRWISKGTLRIKRETLPDTSPWVASLNYGDGDCDFLAIFTVNGVSHQVQLPH